MATLSFNAALVARFQTALSLLAFGSAFAIGCNLHYRKIVKNGVAGYPQEWLPSVSATIGDWYPERNVFQIFIALTAAPRFVILFLTYQLYGSTSLFVFGVLRTLSCGGWVYITSNDSGLMHDVLMIGYIVLNIPWMAGNTLMSKGRGVRRGRTAVATMFFATIAPLIYFYIQHKVHRIPGAYSSYAIFEWSLIFFDIFFDSVTERELRQTGTYITIGPQRLDSSGSAKDKSATEIPAVSDSNTARTATKPQDKHEEVVEKSDVAMKAALESALSPSSHAESKPVKSQIPQVQDVFSSTRAALSFISDLYRSYVFWSLFTVLIPTLFYFSIWELGVAGQEFTLLTLLTPFFLPTTPFFLPSNAETGIKTWFQMLRTKKGQTIASLVQYGALGAWMSDSPVVRLGIVGLSCATMIQREVVLWAGLVKGEGKAEGRGVGYWSVMVLLGFMSASLSKHVNHGNNPIWPFVDPKNGGWNKTGLALALLSLLEFATRRPSLSAPAKPKSDSPKPKAVSPSPYLPTFITTSLPLGSLIFSLHNLLADPSTLVAASWTGWENGKPRGPLPHVFGVATMVTLCLGIALGVGASGSRTPSRRIPATSPVWWFAGCVGAYGLYTERDWEGYGWGLLLAFVLSSVAPRIFEDAAKVARIRNENDDETDDGQASQLGKVYASAMVVYILFNLASIFTVAYAFIPGGWVFRERTDAVLTAQLLCLAPAFSWPGFKKHRELALPSSEPEPDSATTPPSSKKYAYITLALATALSVFGTLYHLPLSPPRPHKPGSTRILNAGIWTVHFGFDNVGHDSQRGMKALIQDMQLDVVGLLETDLHRTAFGHRDLTRVLVEDLGYNVDIGPGPNEHTWGAVLLSKFPIVNTTHHLLPSPHGELAPAIEAVLDVFGTEITVIVAHNGQEEDRLDRELQSTELARIMAASPRPVIFLGYVVTRPHALRPNPYEIMVKDGNVHDIDKDDMDRWCEYIFYRGLYRTSYARVSRGILTDTEMQIGQFVVPKHGTNVTDDSLEARYRRSRKEVLSQHHWFPMEYYGNEKGGGKNGHFYHVFYTPLYYDLPEGAVV
ncbi:hypothetical protein MD484_g8496, partial [Candolleomyces efflorescens]